MVREGVQPQAAVAEILSHREEPVGAPCQAVEGELHVEVEEERPPVAPRVVGDDHVPVSGGRDVPAAGGDLDRVGRRLVVQELQQVGRLESHDAVRGSGQHHLAVRRHVDPEHRGREAVVRGRSRGGQPDGIELVGVNVEQRGLLVGDVEPALANRVRDDLLGVEEAVVRLARQGHRVHCSGDGVQARQVVPVVPARTGEVDGAAHLGEMAWAAVRGGVRRDVERRRVHRRDGARHGEPDVQGRPVGREGHAVGAGETGDRGHQRPVEIGDGNAALQAATGDEDVAAALVHDDVARDDVPRRVALERQQGPRRHRHRGVVRDGLCCCGDVPDDVSDRGGKDQRCDQQRPRYLVHMRPLPTVSSVLGGHC